MNVCSQAVLSTTRPMTSDRTAQQPHVAPLQASTRPLAAVTGASSGIGLELAKQFAQHGFDLIVASDEPQIAGAARQLESHGGAVESVQADLATFDGVEQLYARIAAPGRPLDAIAINAAVGVGGDFADNELEDELRLIALNVSHPVHLAKRVVPQMIARGAGRILFTSSIAAALPGPHYAVYPASKAFVQSFAEALRVELEDTGVTVTALQPGPTDTRFFERAHMEGTKVGASDKDDPAEVARQGFEALMAGKDSVVAGSLVNKVQAAVAGVVPDAVKARLHGRLAEPK